mmetsp:Transcript_81728/g.147599  ORF Transcript_81728/g.147599 Transcript_81728/m.147599 type:complete len:218 (-) Transcript_81728:510-1163(-)
MSTRRKLPASASGYITRFVEQLFGLAENVPMMPDLEEECPWNQEEARSPKKPRFVSFGQREEVSFAISSPSPAPSPGPASSRSPEESRNGNEGGWQQDDEESPSLAAIIDKADVKYSRKCVTAAARNSPTMDPMAQLNVFSSRLWRRRCCGEDESGTSVETNSARSTPTATPFVSEEGVEGFSKESCADREICGQVAADSWQRTSQPAEMWFELCEV